MERTCSFTHVCRARKQRADAGGVQTLLIGSSSFVQGKDYRSRYVPPGSLCVRLQVNSRLELCAGFGVKEGLKQSPPSRRVLVSACPARGEEHRAAHRSSALRKREERRERSPWA
ncbi:hypothetical protein Q5P01_007677 [Channa striata]|uniref:Uncharacterized protein n=1 Tax=Channa striata TaxID=64152 RepID=A0AA88NCJ1_CHASR|nr:hypothetical protein Q5P01_007677 [Channa striata]